MFAGATLFHTGHKKDRTTADEGTPAADIQKRLREAISYESSEGEKKARIFLIQLGIPNSALSKEEFVVLVGILRNPNT
ncbi:MAG: hypothetical protein AB7C97_05395 [Oscillospiraceae bacterium]